ncbi:TPA: hypothetical protein ACGY72_003093 [Stenotrophomonas maltophilia]
MEGIIDRLMEINGGQLLLPLVICGLLVLIIRWLSGLNQSRGAARKEFLEIFHEIEKKDDLWLSVAVRHHFGKNLPVSIIRRLSKIDQPARALAEVASAWPLIDLDDATGELKWRNKRHASKRMRSLLASAFMTGYFLSAFAAVALAYVLIAAPTAGKTSAALWPWVAVGGFVAWWCLERSDLLRSSGRPLERWLGMK